MYLKFQNYYTSSLSHYLTSFKYMEQQVQHRKYKRFKTNLLVGIKTLGSAKEGENTVQATNISLGGIFLSTIYPFPKDTIVELTIKLPGVEKTVKWKGIVRWSSNDPENPGNGIEFIEFENMDKTELTRYITREYLKELINICESNKTYKDFLILWNKYKGKEFEYSTIIKFLNIDQSETEKLMQYFIDLQMIEVKDKKIKFLTLNELSGLNEYIKKIERTS